MILVCCAIKVEFETCFIGWMAEEACVIRVPLFNHSELSQAAAHALLGVLTSWRIRIGCWRRGGSGSGCQSWFWERPCFYLIPHQLKTEHSHCVLWMRNTGWGSPEKPMRVKLPVSLFLLADNALLLSPAQARNCHEFCSFSHLLLPSSNVF